MPSILAERSIHLTIFPGTAKFALCPSTRSVNTQRERIPDMSARITTIDDDWPQTLSVRTDDRQTKAGQNTIRIGILKTDSAQTERAEPKPHNTSHVHNIIGWFGLNRTEWMAGACSAKWGLRPHVTRSRRFQQRQIACIAYVNTERIIRHENVACLLAIIHCHVVCHSSTHIEVFMRSTSTTMWEGDEDGDDNGVMIHAYCVQTRAAKSITKPHTAWQTFRQITKNRRTMSYGFSDTQYVVYDCWLLRSRWMTHIAITIYRIYPVVTDPNTNIASVIQRHGCSHLRKVRRRRRASKTHSADSLASDGVSENVSKRQHRRGRGAREMNALAWSKRTQTYNVHWHYVHVIYGRRMYTQQTAQHTHTAYTATRRNIYSRSTLHTQERSVGKLMQMFCAPTMKSYKCTISRLYNIMLWSVFALCATDKNLNEWMLNDAARAPIV